MRSLIKNKIIIIGAVILIVVVLGVLLIRNTEFGDTLSFSDSVPDSPLPFSTYERTIVPLGIHVAQASDGSLVQPRFLDVRNSLNEPVPELFDVDIIETTDGLHALEFNPRKGTFRPGRYHVSGVVETDAGEIDISQDFYWGVLAMNFNQSVYQPGEESYIQMAVLDDRGDTLCNSTLELQIQHPTSNIQHLDTRDGSIIQNPDCGPNNVVSEPDYFAYYTFDEPGIYQFELTAKTSNGERSIREVIEVSSDDVIESFIVERSGPTRIWPKADYDMTVRIYANQNFSGRFIERVPSSFDVVNFQFPISNFQLISNDTISNDRKEIAWKVDLVAGETYTISYTFDAPDVSPEFYLLGPLQFKRAKEGNDTIFQEARRWHVASDVLIEDMLVYADTGDDSVPRYRLHNNFDGFGAEGSALDMTETIEFSRLASHPSGMTDEKVLCVKGNASAADEDDIMCMVWNGSSWGNSIVVTQNSEDADPSFDVCYEQSSADALVFYRSDTDTTVIYYRIWDGRSWTREHTLLDVGTGNVMSIRCIPEPDTNYLAVMAHDNDDDIELIIWDGDSVSQNSTIDTNGSLCNQCLSYHGAWEALSGDFIAAYYADGDQAIDGSVWTRDTATFTKQNDIIATASIPAGETAWVDMSAVVGSDKVLLVVADDDDDLEQNVWDGSSWGTASQLSANIGTVSATIKPMDLIVEQSSGEGLVTYGSTNTALKYRIYTTGWGAEQSLPTSAAAVAYHELYSDPTSDRAMLVASEVNNIETLEWSGSAWDAAFATQESSRGGGSGVFVYDYESGDDSNSSPAITSVTDTPDPTNPNRSVSFIIDWSDANTYDAIKAKVCKTDSLTSQVCDGGAWASSTSFVTTDPLRDLMYDVVSGDHGQTRSYYVFVCDERASCSSSTSGTFSVNTVSTVENIFIRGGLKIR